MDRYELARTLLCGSYALRADGTVLSAEGGETGWTGVKKLCGSLALRWDGRVLCGGRWAERSDAIGKWRKVKDISCCGPIEAALLESGELTWLRWKQPGHLVYGHCDPQWTDVERFVVTCDPYSEEQSYADYAVGFRADGTARVAYLGGGENRSREIEELLHAVGAVQVDGKCRALSADGKIHHFGTRNMGKTEKGVFADFDLPAAAGAVMVCDNCLLLKDGTVRTPEGLYTDTAGEEWRDILAISTDFLPVETGRHILLALRKDGRVLLAERYGHVTADTSEWKLFDSLDTLEEEREAAKERCLAEGFVLDRQEAEQARKKQVERLLRDRDAYRAALERLKQELAQTRGPFAGGRRKKLEQEIAECEQRLKELEEQLVNGHKNSAVI